MLNITNDLIQRFAKVDDKVWDAYSPLKGDHDQMVAPSQVESELINILQKKAEILTIQEQVAIKMNFYNKRKGFNTSFYLNNCHINIFQTSKISDLKLIFIIEFMKKGV